MGGSQSRAWNRADPRSHEEFARALSARLREVGATSFRAGGEERAFDGGDLSASDLGVAPDSVARIAYRIEGGATIEYDPAYGVVTGASDETGFNARMMATTARTTTKSVVTCGMTGLRFLSKAPYFFFLPEDVTADMVYRRAAAAGRTDMVSAVPPELQALLVGRYGRANYQLSVPGRDLKEELRDQGSRPDAVFELLMAFLIELYAFCSAPLEGVPELYCTDMKPHNVMMVDGGKLVMVDFGSFTAEPDVYEYTHKYLYLHGLPLAEQPLAWDDTGREYAVNEADLDTRTAREVAFLSAASTLSVFAIAAESGDMLARARDFYYREYPSATKGGGGPDARPPRLSGARRIRRANRRPGR